MPINFIQEGKKQKYLALIVMAVVIITAVILWFGYFREERPAVFPVPARLFREIKMDFNVLESPFLQESQVFKKIPSFEGEMGRKNPFLPY